MKRGAPAALSILAVAFFATLGASLCDADEILHYTFDQVDTVVGTPNTYTTPDSSTNAITGTLMNMTDANLVPGRIGNALQFNGGTSTATRNRVEVPATNAVLNATFTDFTFSALVNPNLDPAATTTAFIAGKIGTNNTRGWQIGYQTNTAVSPNQLVLDVFQDAPKASPFFEAFSGDGTALPNNQWSQVAFTLSTSDASPFVRMYINGVKVLDQSITITQLNGINTKTFQVGNRGDSTIDSWTGMIDDVHIFNTALTDTQIAALVPPSQPKGDFNQNGVIDAADYVVWRKNNGSATALPNDNGLGSPVGSAQYDLWRSNFGATSGSGSGSLIGVAVPEPSSWLLTFAAFTAGFGGCHRRNRV